MESGETTAGTSEQVLADLLELSRWSSVRGPGAVQLRVEIEDRAPGRVREAAERLGALVSTVPYEDPTDLALAELDWLCASLDDRELAVLRDRFAAEKPATLAELGTRFDVTRERIRQIESKLRKRLESAFDLDTATGLLIAGIRAELQPVAALSRLTARIPQLASEVAPLDAPLWRVLDRLDDDFEVVDGWAAAPSVLETERRTSDLLAEYTSENGVADIDAVADAWRLPEEELSEWLQYCGYQVLEGQVLTRIGRASDHAAAVLEVAGEPLSLDRIIEMMVTKRARGTMVNALGQDERFVRSGKSTWALAEWGVEEYAGVRASIARIVDAVPGGVPLVDVVESISSRTDVSPSSVQTYASSGMFEVVEGKVRRRLKRAVPRKTPAQSRNVFRVEEGLALAVTVNRDHLRGSGGPVPSAVAGFIGCEGGSSVTLASADGPVTVAFTHQQPTIGSVRRFLLDDFAEGERAFFLFGADSTFAVRRPAQSAENDPLAQALAHVGHPDPLSVQQQDRPAAIGAALWLDREDRPRRVLSSARARGDETLVELLESAWIRAVEPPS